MHFHLTRRVLNKASRIFAVSSFTKIEIEKLFGMPNGQIEVIYNAIDERFLHGHASESRPPVDRRALSGELSVPALRGKNQPAQKRGAHHRSILGA